ncbi:MAG: hypothetical protein KAS67_06885 [Thermoplasmata archaeon]|nr:hypothetical protein [Thermoplasmata archaeon]
MFRKFVDRYVKLASLILVVILALSFTASPLFQPVVNESFDSLEPELAQDAGPAPEPKAQPPEEEPLAWSDDGDFLVSFEEDTPVTINAQQPDIAIAPPGSPWAGSIHTVWMEMNNAVGDIPFYEIHYSMSEADQRGMEWSNDEAAENDTILSDSAEATSPQADAQYPSIAIDPQGIIHVVWSQTYSDWTYEVHYSRSIDNGKTWSGYTDNTETLVSYREGSNDSPWVDSPKIAVSTNPLILHAVWTEVSPIGEATEIFYSRSIDQGMTWSGTGGNLPISNPGSQTPISFPADIAVGGADGKDVHVVWTQDVDHGGGFWSSEVFYACSSNYGELVSWEPERIISQSIPDDTYAADVKVAAFEDNVHVIWNQWGVDGEVYYSGSWNGGVDWSNDEVAEGDQKISHSDGEFAESPVVATSPENGGMGAHVIWTEIDEKSPLGSFEIHESINPMALDPLMWSGTDQDNVISFPDSEALADAHSPAMDIGYIAGEWRSQIVWQEKNVQSLTGDGHEPVETLFNLAEHGTQVHYLPETTFNRSSLSTGWNFISIPLVQNNESILTVLDDSWGDNSTTWDQAMWYDPTDTADHWKSYNINYPGTQDLLNIDHSIGIWLKITSLGDGNLTFAGDFPNSTTIQLKAGWNLIGYPAQNDSAYTVSQLKSATGASAVEGYDSGNIYNLKTLADSYVLTKGEAYWVKVASDTPWTVDW